MAKNFLQKRNDMIEKRIKMLSGLTDLELAKTIAAYFENNRTMPGEKWIKDTANQMLAGFTEDAVTTLLEPARATLIEDFAAVCVRSMPIKYVEVANDTKKNKESRLRKASELPMTLCESVPVPLKNNTVMKNIYEIPASLNVMEKSVYVKDTENNNLLVFYLGRITKGFYKNHFIKQPVDCTVIATDHSNGNFANMSYHMLVDLCPA